MPFGAGDLGTPGGANGQPEKEFEIDEEVVDQQQPELKASLRFSPFDDMEHDVLARMASAKTHVRLSYYNVRLMEVLWILEVLVEDGVDVEVMLDKKTQDLEFNTMGVDLVEAGIPVVLIDNDVAEKALMHHKFTIIDKEVVITGSANLSSTALNKSDEDLLVVENTDLAARFLTEYEEIKADGYAKSEPYPDGTPIKAWMGPEDDLDGKVIGMMKAASSTVLVAMFQINQKGLVDALIDTHNDGKTVIVVMDGIFKADGNTEVTLAEAGIPVILAENKASMYSEMHSKLLITDESRVAMGSYNWTNLASFHNHESLIVIEDQHLAIRAAGKFAELIKAYSTKSASELGLTTGKQSVTIEVVNITLPAGSKLVIKDVAGGGTWSQPTELSGTQVKIDLETGTRLDYRYGVKSADGSTYWETGAKHFFTVPYAPGPFVVTDAFRP